GSADRERRVERLLDSERNAIGLPVVQETAQQDGEFVAAKSREGVAGPQAGFEPARDRDEQFVADQVTEAVVDDLEAIQIEVQHCEAAVDRTQSHLFEPPTQALDEDLAVEQAGERVDDADTAE